VGDPKGVKAARGELLEAKLAGELEGLLCVGVRRVWIPSVDGHLGEVPLRLGPRRPVTALLRNLQGLLEQVRRCAYVPESLHQEDRKAVQGGALESRFPLVS
jgi:hypothetical protein